MKSRWLIVTLLPLVLVACGLPSGGGPPPMTPTPFVTVPAPTLPPAPETPGATVDPLLPTDDAAAAPQPGDSTPTPADLPPTPADLPETSGHYLLLASPSGSVEDGGVLLAVSDNGQQVVQVTDQMIPARDITPLAAPAGGHVAYLAASPGFRDLRLVIAGPPDLSTPLEVIELTGGFSEDDLDSILDFDSPAWNAVWAVAEFTSLAWSPDGRRLAFMGMINGSTSDLYVYSLDDGSITQLTDGPSQGIHPVWSPDGRYIAHVGVDNFGTGAGYAIAGVWAADTVEGGVVTLADSSSGDEIFAGWAGPTTLVMYSWSVICGLNNLRALDLETGETTTIWGEYFDLATLGDNGSVLFTVSEAAYCNEADPSTGLFIADVGYAEPPRQVSPQVPTEFIWSPILGSFLATVPAGVVQILPTGNQAALLAPASELPAVAPDGTLMAWALRGANPTPGLWLSTPDRAARPIYEQSAHLATWHPSERRLFFFGEEGLYMAGEPAFEPVLVQPGLNMLAAAWVIP